MGKPIHLLDQNRFSVSFRDFQKKHPKIFPHFSPFLAFSKVDRSHGVLRAAEGQLPLHRLHGHGACGAADRGDPVAEGSDGSPGDGDAMTVTTCECGGSKRGSWDGKIWVWVNTYTYHF